jgi:hypothetical protein
MLGTNFPTDSFSWVLMRSERLEVEFSDRVLRLGVNDREKRAAPAF